MKIKEIQAVRVRFPERKASPTPPRRPWWGTNAPKSTPMSRYAEGGPKNWGAPWAWGDVWAKATAEDGTWGLGQTSYGRVTATIIEEHFAPVLQGQDCLAIQRLSDMMLRMSKAYGASGLACFAISAVDLALWDLAGKLQGRPVYQLLGGPVRDRIPVYATGNDVDWYLELGFQAMKVACPYSPYEGLKGLEGNERLVADARALAGNGVDLMLDCWMGLDVAYTIRLAECLRPYRLRWIEEFLLPEDIEGHAAVRRAIPWMGLATGEHLFTRWPFQQLIEARSVDILQPDIQWVGGLTECLHICHLAEAAGLIVIPHTGGNTQFGLHLTYATPNMPWAEYFIATPPGVPLEENDWCYGVPGRSIPKDGYIVPNDGPGFGLGMEEDWLVPYRP